MLPNSDITKLFQDFSGIVIQNGFAGWGQISADRDRSRIWHEFLNELDNVSAAKIICYTTYNGAFNFIPTGTLAYFHTIRGRLNKPSGVITMGDFARYWTVSSVFKQDVPLDYYTVSIAYAFQLADNAHEIYSGAFEDGIRLKTSKQWDEFLVFSESFRKPIRIPKLFGGYINTTWIDYNQPEIRAKGFELGLVIQPNNLRLLPNQQPPAIPDWYQVFFGIGPYRGKPNLKDQTIADWSDALPDVFEQGAAEYQDGVKPPPIVDNVATSKTESSSMIWWIVGGVAAFIIPLFIYLFNRKK